MLSFDFEAANGTDAAKKMIPEVLHLLVLGAVIYRHVLFPLRLRFETGRLAQKSAPNFSRLSRVPYACRDTRSTDYKRIPYLMYWRLTCFAGSKYDATFLSGPAFEPEDSQ